MTIISSLQANVPELDRGHRENVFKELQHQHAEHCIDTPHKSEEPACPLVGIDDDAMCVQTATIRSAQILNGPVAHMMQCDAGIEECQHVIWQHCLSV